LVSRGTQSKYAPGELLDSPAVAGPALGLGRLGSPPRAGPRALCPGPGRFRESASIDHRRHRAAASEAEKPRKTGPFLQRAQEEALRHERGHRQYPGEAERLPEANVPRQDA